MSSKETFKMKYEKKTEKKSLNPRKMLRERTDSVTMAERKESREEVQRKMGRHGVLVRGDLGGGGEVRGKGLDLEELSGAVEGLERAIGQAGKAAEWSIETRPAHPLDNAAQASLSSLSTRGTAYAHIPAAPGNLSLSI